MINQEKMLEQYMAKCGEEYCEFVGISALPQYELVSKGFSGEVYRQRGYETWAEEKYLWRTKGHHLTVCYDLPNQVAGKFTLFHEMTHMVDEDNYFDGDPGKSIGIHGFTEYHASQVELMAQCGAKNINKEIAFSMNSVVDTLGGKTKTSKCIDDIYNTVV